MATHRELITAGKFDEKFKRSLLDYYSYGFKNLASYDARKRQTISEDWLRLNRVLSDYLEWSDNHSKIMFANADSQAMDTNPFHRIYRFCRYKPVMYPAFFLHTFSALDQNIELREGCDSLGLDYDRRIRLEDLIADGGLFKTSDLICFYGTELVITDAGDKNKTPNNRLSDLEKIGILSCKQENGVKGGKGDHRWSAPELTMAKLMEAGTSIDKGFVIHLQSALDFFSKYYILGEVGTFLLDRLNENEISPFRFKHEYFMQAVNDFNLIDLLYAIENNRWCKIKYSHGTAGFETELLCYPLEIRISNTQGREFLVYYEPFKRSYTSLRLEFIDSIEYFEESETASVLSKTESGFSLDTVHRDIENAKKSIKYSWGVSSTKNQAGNAAEIVRPATVSLKIKYDRAKDYYILNRLKRECRFGRVSVSEEEPYIDFSVDVSDPAELRPWLRSFYSRIIDCTGMDSDTFSLSADIRKIAGAILCSNWEAPAQLANSGNSNWKIPKEAVKLLGSGVKAREHERIFNEVFSVYYYIIAGVFTSMIEMPFNEDEIDEAIKKISRKTYVEERADCLPVQLQKELDEHILTMGKVNQLIRDSFSEYYLKYGDETEDLLMDEIKHSLLANGLVRKIKKKIVYNTVPYGRADSFLKSKRETELTIYLPKYKSAKSVNFYKDVVPLSTQEIRWLKSILKDSKMKYFMSDKEIESIRALLKKTADSIPELPMDKIVFFDRFHFPEKDIFRETGALSTLLEGIYNQKTVQLKYYAMNKSVIEGEFKPIVLEFSKRDNRFQAYLRSCENDPHLCRKCFTNCSGGCNRKRF